jgi:hypothetical protein
VSKKRNLTNTFPGVVISNRATVRNLAHLVKDFSSHTLVEMTVNKNYVSRETKQPRLKSSGYATVVAQVKNSFHFSQKTGDKNA